MKKILTLLIDGLGVSDNEHGNAFESAKMPNYEKLIETYPHSLLDASGPAVGLPEGQAGNETVGYMTIGAGKVLKQRSSFVHDFIDEDSLATNTLLKSAIEHARKKKSTFHIMGLMSDGGINSNIDDIIKIIEFLKKENIKIGIDFIADGKDVEAKSAIKYIEKIEATGVPILSVCGRYYAMDKDEKWDRTRIYYDLVRNGVGLKVKELPLALKNCYIRNITDEFLPPMLVTPDHNIKDNDVVFWVNYHEEGASQILIALTNPDEVTEFQTRKLNNTKVLMMYPVNSKINATVLMNDEDNSGSTLGAHLSKLDLTQARIADKFAYDYVTYYFNGETKGRLSKCNNYLVDLPESIEGKGLEINAAGIVKQITKCMERDTDFILASIDAASIVGHTGDFDRTVKMLEFIDDCLGRIVSSAELNFYTIVLSSAYGCIESMLDEDGKKTTTNTTNKVPLVITDNHIDLEDGSLRDLAPTILSYMDISIPESMRDANILIKE